MSKLDEIEAWVGKAAHAHDISGKEHSEIDLLIRAVRQLGRKIEGHDDAVRDGHTCACSKNSPPLSPDVLELINDDTI